MTDCYSIVIQWSAKNNCFVASLPEWKNCNAQGNSYEEALENAQAVLNSLIKSSKSEGNSLPEPQIFQIEAVNS